MRRTIKIWLWASLMVFFFVFFFVGMVYGVLSVQHGMTTWYAMNACAAISAAISLVIGGFIAFFTV